MGTPDPPSSRGTMRPFYFLVFDALLSRKRTRFGTLRETLGRIRAIRRQPLYATGRELLCGMPTILKESSPRHFNDQRQRTLRVSWRKAISQGSFGTTQ